MEDIDRDRFMTPAEAVDVRARRRDPAAAPPLRRPVASASGIRGIHHVGIAVADLDAALATYLGLLGAALEHRDLVPDQGVEAASVLVGSSRMELLAPLAEDTPVGRFLAKRGPGVHHVAYEVDDVAAALAGLAQGGVDLIDTDPRVGLFGCRSLSSTPTPSTAFSRRSHPLPDSPDSVRIEVAFAGGPIIAANVSPAGATRSSTRWLPAPRGRTSSTRTTGASRSSSAGWPT